MRTRLDEYVHCGDAIQQPTTFFFERMEKTMSATMTTTWMNMGTLAGGASCLGNASLGSNSVGAAAVSAASTAASAMNTAAQSVATVWDGSGFAMPSVLGNAAPVMALAASEPLPDIYHNSSPSSGDYSFGMAGLGSALLIGAMAFVLVAMYRSSNADASSAKKPDQKAEGSSDRPSPLPTNVRTGARREMTSMPPSKGPSNPYERRLHGYMPLMGLGAAAMMKEAGALHADYDGVEPVEIDPTVAGMAGGLLAVAIITALGVVKRKQLAELLSIPEKPPKRYGPVTGTSMTSKVEGVTGRSVNPEPELGEQLTRVPKAPQVPRF